MGPKKAGYGAPPDPRAPSNFVGLENQGATCYLNSLIQALYMTPELRHWLYALDPHEHLSVQTVEEEEREKAAERAALSDGQAVNETFLEMLTGMGCDQHGSRRALVAVKSSSFDAALDYYGAHCDDAGFNDPPPEDAAALAKNKVKRKRARMIPLEIQRIFSQMQHLQQRAISTEALTTKGFQWQGFDGRVQHDAHELNRLLIEALEKSLSRTPGDSLCKTLYVGTIAYKTVCLSCSIPSEREENFYDLNIQVLDCEDLPMAMRKYCAAEILEGDSAYECVTCAGKRTAHRASVLRKLPPILAFSCNRFKIDKSTNWQRAKITDKSAFPLVLDMKPFLEGTAGSSDVEGDAEKENEYLTNVRQNMTWISDAQAAAVLVANELINMRGDDVQLEDTSDDVLKDMLMSAAGDRADSLRYLSGNQGPFSNDASNTESSATKYSLFAVINHRGTAHSGHYFAYIRDCLGEGRWELPAGFADIDTPKASGGVLPEDPASLGYLKTPRGYVVDCDQPAGIVMKAILAEGNVEQGGRKSLRTDQIVQYLKRHGDQRNPNVLNFIESSRKVSIIDTAKYFPVLFEVTGSIIQSAGLGIEVIDAKDFQARVAEDAKKRVTAPAVAASVAAALANATGGTSQSPQSPFDNNEALSAALQSAGDNDELSAFASQEDGGDSNWEAQSGKKKKSKKAGSAAPGNLSGANTKAGPDGNGTGPQPRNSAARALAHKLAGRFFGNFFEFNDSSVTAMPLAGLEKAFEGTDSAYLLVYRKLDAGATRSSSSSSGDGKLEMLSSVQPPQYWLDKVNDRNAELAFERENFVKRSYMVKVSIFFPAHMKVSGPLLTNQHLETAPEKFQDRLEVDIDTRQTVRVLLRTILLESLHCNDHMCIVDFKPRLSLLMPYAEGFHCQEPLDDELTLDFLLRRDKTQSAEMPSFLVWHADSQKIKDIVVTVGKAEDDRLLRFAVSRVSEDESGVVKKDFEPLWLTAGDTVLGLCLQAAATADIHVDSASVYAIESTGEFGKNAAAVLVYSRGELVGPHDETSMLSQVRASRLIVEMTRDDNVSLATKYIEKQNQTWTIRVDLDFGTSAEPALQRALALTRSKSQTSAPSPDDVLPFATPEPHVTIETDSSLSMLSLKHAVFTILELDPATWKDKLVWSTGEGVIKWPIPDSKYIYEAVRSSSMVVTLSLPQENLNRSLVATIAKVTVMCSVYTGNDQSPTFNPQQQGTRKGDEKRLQISPTDTITQVRDKLGVELLGLQPNWTLDAALNQKYRLRHFNASRDHVQLLVESRPAGKKTPDKSQARDKLGPLTLRRLKVGTGAVLHLEEGPPQFEGVGKYHVLLWSATPHSGPDSGHPHTPCVALDATSVTLSAAPATATAAPSSATAPDALDAAQARYRQHLVPLGSLECHEEASLADLQAMVFTRLKSDDCKAVMATHLPAEKWAPPPSADHFLLRDLRSNLLPGAGFWTYEVAGAANQLNIINNVGAGKKTNAKLDGKSKTVKSLKFTSHEQHQGQPRRYLVVELLQGRTQLEARPRPSGSFRVWATVLTNPSSQEGTAVMGIPGRHDYPPLQVSVCGPQPSLNHLKRPIASELGMDNTANVDAMRVFRLNPSRGDFLELVKPAHKKKENLCEGPFGLTEGDLVCVFTLPPASKYATHSDKDNIVVSRAEDVCLRKRIERTTQIARELKAQSKGKGVSVAKKAQIREMALNIGGDLDFDMSSDEEEGEGGDGDGEADEDEQDEQ